MIEVNNLKKDYEIIKRKSLLNKERTIVNAVKSISVQIEDGERVGLIGLNGAGKTTTIKMMTGILYPTNMTKLVGEKKTLSKNKLLQENNWLIVKKNLKYKWRMFAFDKYKLLI